MSNLCSSCGCCQPCSCIYQNIFQQGGSGSPATAGQCVNLSGICVLDAYTSNTMYFRGMDSTNSALLSVALNATNHTIELTLNVAAIAAAIPQATTSQAGIGETATDVEAQAKASIVNFVTPSNFAAMGSSTTFAGLIEIATDAEAITGVSTTLAITPANLAATIAANYGTTVTFADAVARAGAVPDFAGQYGYQTNTQEPYVSTSTAAGAWSPLFVFGGANIISPASATTVAVDPTTSISFSGDGVFDLSGGMNLRLGSGSVLNFDPTILQVGSFGSTNALLGVNGSGEAAFNLIADFVSLNNTQTGYTTFGASATLRTCNTGTVTLQQLAQIVGTLIEDLKAVKLPAT